MLLAVTVTVMMIMTFCAVVVMLVIMIMMVVMIVVMVVIVIFQSTRLTGFLQLLLVHFADRRIFLVFFDLFDVERNPKALRKVALGNSPVASHSRTSIEMLVVPEERRRNHGTGFPVQLDHFAAFQAALPCQGKTFAVQSKDDRFVRMAMPKLVMTDFEFRDVRFENRVARHVPVHARIARSSLFPIG